MPDAPKLPADLTEDVSCTLRIAVDRRGRPTEVTFHEGCPEPARLAFAEAVRKWRFAKPRDDEGRPTATAITLTMALDVTPDDEADSDDDTEGDAPDPSR